MASFSDAVRTTCLATGRQIDQFYFPKSPREIATDEETLAYLTGLEHRLMGRMNDNQERMLERMRGLDTSIAGLTELARSANTLMAVIASSPSDIAGRVTRLESKT